MLFPRLCRGLHTFLELVKIEEELQLWRSCSAPAPSAQASPLLPPLYMKVEKHRWDAPTGAI